MEEGRERESWLHKTALYVYANSKVRNWTSWFCMLIDCTVGYKGHFLKKTNGRSGQHVLSASL